MPLNPADDAFAESLRRALPDDRLRRAEPRYLEEPRGRWAGGSGWVALPRSADEVSTLIRAADVVVVRFGDQYRQWNAAFDAGFATACDKLLIVLHPPDLQHALKEVDAAALAVASEPEQVVEILRYAISK